MKPTSGSGLVPDLGLDPGTCNSWGAYPPRTPSPSTCRGGTRHGLGHRQAVGSGGWLTRFCCSGPIYELVLCPASPSQPSSRITRRDNDGLWGASCARLRASWAGEDCGLGLCQLEPLLRLSPPPEMTALTPAGLATPFGSCLHPSLAGGTNGRGVNVQGPEA